MDECYTIESQTDCLCVRARWRFDFNIYTVFFLVVCTRSQVRGATAQLPRRDDRRFTRKHSAFLGAPIWSNFLSLFFPSRKQRQRRENWLTKNTHTFFCSLGNQHRTRKTKLRLLEGAPRTQLNTYTNARKVTQNKTRTRLDDFRLPTNTAQDRLNEATKQAESDGGGVVGKKQCWVGCGCVATLTTCERANAFNSNMVVFVH